MIGGLAPQPRLLWAIAIGAALIALSIASPLLGFVAVAYHVGLLLVLARDLALLPARSGYRVRRQVPDPFSLGEVEEVRVVVENPAAAGLNARVADHAPAELKPHPRELAGRFDKNGRLAVSYVTSSPRRGAFRFGRNQHPVQDLYALRVVRGASGALEISTVGKVLTNHADAYSSDCKL